MVTDAEQSTPRNVFQFVTSECLCVTERENPFWAWPIWRDCNQSPTSVTKFRKTAKGWGGLRICCAAP